MIEISLGVASIILVLIGVLISWIGLNTSKINGIKKDAMEKGQLLTEISGMKKSIDTLSTSVSNRLAVIDDRAETKNISCAKHGEMLVAVKASSDSAHKRLDEHRELFTDINRKLDDIRNNQKEGGK